MTKDILPSKYRYDKNMSRSFGTQHNNGLLEIWVGFPYNLGGYTRIGQIVTPYITMALDRLSWSVGDRGKMVQDDVWSIGSGWQGWRIAIDL
jgi:hypothetical protein